MAERVIVLQTAAKSRPVWIDRCLQSVADWAAAAGLEYRFQGDACRALVPDWVWPKVAHAMQAGFDLLRLVWLEETLAEEADAAAAIWLDADVLILDAQRFAAELPRHSCFAVGRENWLETDAGGRVTLRKHVHNAVLWAQKGNPVVPFYRYASERILERVEPPFVPQLIGPKLLSSWHNVVQFDVIEGCSMLSPALANAIVEHDRTVIERFLEMATTRPSALNLCSSLMDEPTGNAVVDELQRGCFEN